MKKRNKPNKIEQFGEYSNCLRLNGEIDAVNECLKNALNRLEEKDRANIDRIIENFPNIKGCGQASMLELLAKLGLFLSSEEHK